MQRPTNDEAHPAHMSDQQVPAMLRSATVEVAAWAGDEVLERMASELRAAFDAKAIARMHNERDRMLFVSSIAALPSIEAPETADPRLGTSL